MVAAKGHDPWFWIVVPSIVLGVIAVLVGFGAGLIFVRRRYERRAGAALERILAEAGAYEVRGSGDPVVEVRFHTYRGVLFWTTQTEHRFAAPLSRAMYLLDRLHEFNLKWNWKNPGSFWVPVLSWGNRKAQQRRMLRQAREQGWTE